MATKTLKILESYTWSNDCCSRGDAISFFSGGVERECSREVENGKRWGKIGAATTIINNKYPKSHLKKGAVVCAAALLFLSFHF